MDGDNDTWTDSGTQVATTLADMNMQGLDLDSDGVSNADEATEETNPYSGDTDFDGMTDSEEIFAGCNPLVDDAHADYDGDRYPNIFEVKNSSDPFAVGSIPTPHYVVDPNGGGTHTSLYEPSYWAYNYEIILVQPGTYSGWENTGITLHGDVLLISADGAATTIIDGQGTNAGISLYGNAVVEGFTIKNTSNYYGGAVYATSGNPSIINCILLNNKSDGTVGGAIYTSGADLMVVHCTAVGNAPHGIHADSSAITVHNSIFWNRQGLETLLENGATLEVSNSIFRGGYAGTGNLSSDPQVTPQGTLKHNSPAINAAAALYTSGKDVHGEPRPTATVPDIGADEWLDSDADNLPDAWEQQVFGGLSHDGTADGDSDGLNDLGEYGFGSDPALADADGDGANDGAEFAAGSNPFSSDSDGDNLPDGYEIAEGLNPGDAKDALDDKDGDRVPNLYEFHRSTSAGTPDTLVPDFTVDANGSGTHLTIGDAVTDANYVGDWQVILVKKGTYSEAVDLYDKRILLLGELGSDLPQIVGPMYYSAVSITAGDVVVDGFVIKHPDASSSARGIYVSLYEGSAVRLANTFITSNFQSYGGAGLYLAGGECRLDHCTLFGNGVPTGHSSSQPVEGLAIYVDDGALRLRNTIVWNPGGPVGSTQVQVDPGSQFEALNSIILGAEHGASGSDPLLTASGHLLLTSPAINPAGGLLFSIPSQDVHGESRTSPPDIGADEYVDSDADGLPEWWEMLHFGNLSHDGTADGDSDGLNDLGEFLFGTNPAVADEDGDGANDGAEQAAGSNPRDTDTDDDTIPDGYEIAKGLNPIDPRDTLEDKDGDRVPNIYEYNRGTDAAVAVALVPDVTVDPAVNPETATVKKTISAAVSAANSQAGDWKLIFVKKGTYTAALSLSSKRIALLGEKSPTPPEIAPTTASTALSIYYADTVVDGFVIKHQNPQQSSNGIYFSLSQPARARISNCFIQENHDDYGAGINVIGGECLVDHCTFARNNVPTGAGIYTLAPVNGLAVAVQNTAKLRMRNSVVWNTGAPAGSTQIWVNSYATVQVSSSIILGAEHGASGADPLLDRYACLLPGSPAINASGSGGFSLANTDIHGEARTSPADLGADEYVDSDSDGLADWWETRFVGNLSSNGSANPDADGLTHLQEYLFSSNPTVADTDADGANDAAEQTAGTSPWDADTDGDGIPDGYEISKSLAPLDYRDALEDKDADRIPNIYEYNRSWDANSASSPATLTPDVTVDPAVVTETATVKRTIGTALSTAKSAAGDWKIVIVKKGVYPESGLNLSTKRILLMSERAAAPAVIASSTTTACVNLTLSGSVLDGIVLKHTSPPHLSNYGAYISVSGYLAQVRIVDSVITDNAASSGAGIYLAQGEAIVDHCTLFNNKGGQWNGGGGQGPGVYLSYGTKVRVRNSILWNPTTTVGVQQINGGSNTVVEADNNLILGGEHGGINLDPLLDVYGYLRAGSPAINPSGGVNLASVTKDIQGETRTNPADLGADEYGDSDGDSLPDSWELRFLGNLTANGSTDSDGDGLTNAQEYTYGSNPGAVDTDGDGTNDSAEHGAGTDPWDSDTDDDGIPDNYEIAKGLDPLDLRDALEDKDGDRIPNVYEFNRSWDANSASSPASLVPDVTVNPAVNPETATVKKTITAAVTAANAQSGSYRIILVQAGAYSEAVTVSSKPTLILGQRGYSPPVLNGTSGQSSISLQKKDSAVDGIVVRHATGLQGSAVYVSLAQPNELARVTNCILTGNTKSSGGAAAHIYRGDLSLAHITASQNKASYGGVFNVDSDNTLSLENSIVWNTGLSTGVAQIYKASTATVTVSNSIVRGGEFGGQNVDPDLSPESLLLPVSAAINPSGGMAVVGLDKDIHGETRTSPPDLGADEFVDTDSDDLPDAWEQRFFGNLTKNADGDDDTPAGDGLENLLELFFGLDPTDPDTDNDGIDDLDEAIALAGANMSDPASWLADQDGDGLTLYQELLAGTDPNLADTNGDGYQDGFGAPVISSVNLDHDGDGISNASEIVAGTDPFKADTDGDGYNDNVDAYPLNGSLHAPIAPDPGDTIAPTIILWEPGDAVKLP